MQPILAGRAWESSRQQESTSRTLTPCGPGSRESWSQDNPPGPPSTDPFPSVRPHPPKTVPPAGEWVLDAWACGDIHTQPQHTFLHMPWDVNPNDTWAGISFVSPPPPPSLFCLDFFSLCCGSVSPEKESPHLLPSVEYPESYATFCPSISVALLRLG